MKRPIWFIAFCTLALSACQTLSTANINSYFTSDQTVTTNIQAAFYNNPVLVGVPIHVETHEGIVQLDGYVKTIKQSDIAYDIATHTPGAKQVQNNLIVKK